jgi:TPR repeat protein
MYKKVLLASIVSITLSGINAAEVENYNNVFSLENIEERYENNPFAVFYRADNERKIGNYDEAFRLFKMAADLGLREASHNVGYMYFNGVGVEKNYMNAAKYLNVSGNKGILESQMLMGYLYTTEDKGPTISLKEAYNWYYKAAAQGNLEAKYYVGNMLFYGRGTNMDTVIGLALLEEVAEETNNRKIYHEIGEIYRKGVSQPRNLERASFFYEQAAKLGYQESQAALGDLHYNGINGTINKEKALYWYTEAALNGSVKVMPTLATMYLKAQGTEQDVEQAIKWLNEAAKFNNPEALYMLAGLYFKNNYGIEVDSKKAVNFYKLAVSAGHKEAIREFAIINRRGIRGVVEADNIEYTRLMNLYYEDTPETERKEFNMFQFKDNEIIKAEMEDEFYKSDFNQYFQE